MPKSFKAIYVRPEEDAPEGFMVWCCDYYDLEEWFDRKVRSWRSGYSSTTWSKYWVTEEYGEWWNPKAHWEWLLTYPVNGPNKEYVYHFDNVGSGTTKDPHPST